MVSWTDGVWCWNVVRVHEVLGRQASVEMTELNTMLVDVQLTTNGDDDVVWPFDVSKCYTVRSGYQLLLQQQQEGELDSGRRQGLEYIWAAQVPSKLKIFCWRVILDRLPTRNQLIRRGIIANNHEAMCVFCGLYVEEPDHIFNFCSELRVMWDKIMRWLDFDSYGAADCCEQLRVGIAVLAGKYHCKRAAAIWMTIWWCIWKTRNNIIFNNAVLDCDELFFSIVWYSWWWLGIEAKDRIRCNFYEWFKNPSLCK
ncbi:uncharacterized protein LOC131648556 [Vicia villosa]|uniref:uncharacterized protein LOC131648556 n=1 Tax=Vicia villosa TaxID=3911 RepID=UPI00273ABC8B|nr:uncharacterized protein LOC131648556 [Vicia villosa]